MAIGDKGATGQVIEVPAVDVRDVNTNMVAVVPHGNPLALPPEEELRAQIQAVNRFQLLVHTLLVENQDYGVIPGTGKKPTLLKPGAEKIVKILGLADEYEIANCQEDWQRGFFRYLVRCRLTHIGTGHLVATGLGECNSMESKYRWREQRLRCPKCGQETIFKSKYGGYYCASKRGGCGGEFKDGTAEARQISTQPQGRVPNDDTFSLVNTILKMASKRAMIGAALSAGRLSEIFTQDVEDLAENGALGSRPTIVDGDEAPAAPPPAPRPPAPPAAPVSKPSASPAPAASSPAPAQGATQTTEAAAPGMPADAAMAAAAQDVTPCTSPTMLCKRCQAAGIKARADICAAAGIASLADLATQDDCDKAWRTVQKTQFGITR